MAKKLRHLKGHIPILYDWEVIHTLATAINILVDQVNELSEKVEQLERVRRGEDGN